MICQIETEPVLAAVVHAQGVVLAIARHRLESKERKGLSMFNLIDIQNMEGKITDAEVAYLASCAATIKQHGVCLEVGSFRGKSTAAILHGLPKDAHLISIDLHMLNPTTKQGYETAETLVAYRNNIESHKQQVTQIIGYNVSVSKWFAYPINFAFFDCCKTFDGMKVIWDAWRPNFVPGSTIAFHDYNPQQFGHNHFPGMVQFIEEVAMPATTDHKRVDYIFSGVYNGQN